MNLSTWLSLLAGLLLAMLPLAAQGQQAAAVQPVADTAALMPRHGTVSIRPATQWEDGLAAGNGIMGALLYGDPRHDTLVVDHCKLWLPLGSREVMPDMVPVLPEMRRIIGEQGYQAGQNFFLDTARKQGCRLTLPHGKPVTIQARFRAAGAASTPAPDADASTHGAWGDQGDGTYVNPILPADFSDIDAIRVGTDFYAISSTFQYSPGVVILHSKDLVNWNILGHAVSDITQIGPDLNWDRMDRYGTGVWAGSLRYHAGKFWIYFDTPDEGFFMTTATNPAGPWDRSPACGARTAGTTFARSGTTTARLTSSVPTMRAATKSISSR